MNDDRHFPSCNPRRVLTTEHFLQTHRQHRRLSLFIVQSHMGTTRHGEMGRCEAGQFLPLWPGQQTLKRWLEIDVADLCQAHDAVEERTQPAFEIPGERPIGKIRPAGIDAMEKRDTGSPLLQVFGPGETGEACPSQAEQERGRDLMRIRLVDGTVVENQLS